jgi:hypothetical protein
MAGMAFYPILYLSLLEAPRILYLPSGRAFAALVFLAVFVLANRSYAPSRTVRMGNIRPQVAPAMRSSGEYRR